jgi:hypothetical protein
VLTIWGATVIPILLRLIGAIWPAKLLNAA